MNMEKTIGNRLRGEGGATSGFDYLRIGLAVAVVLVHSFPISYGGEARFTRISPFLLPLTMMIVPSFFALSGFLVSASFEREPLPSFIALRVLRIFPALVVEVLLSALILGPLMTSLSLMDYLTSPVFFDYFNNIRGFIHYQLPGVFANSPYPGVVNGSLWTVPHELECYLLLIAVGLFLLAESIGKNATRIAVAAIVVAACVYVRSLNDIEIKTGQPIVAAFVFGGMIYRWRDRLPMNRCLFVVCFVASYVIQHFLLFNWILDTVTAATTAYATVYIGLLNPKKVKLIRGADYSYGIYLYAFPVQQAVASVLRNWANYWWLNSILGLLIVSFFAAFSWRFVEKPTLRLKKQVKDMCRRGIGFDAASMSAPFWRAVISAKAAEAHGRDAQSKI